MNYQQLIECGVDQWNQWRSQYPTQRPDLSGVDLRRFYLYEVDLSGSDLSGANLSRACLIGANLSKADLAGADLRGAYLGAANLSAANLSHANLTGAQIVGANLKGANLTGTCLELMDQNLSQALVRSTAQPETNDAPTVALQGVGKIVASSNELLPPVHYFSVSDVKLMPAIQRADVSRLAQQPERVPPPVEFSSSTPVAWPLELLDHCHRKLSDYYISPLVTMILNDIIELDQPNSQRQLIESVAAHIPDPQEAQQFCHSAASWQSEPQQVMPHQQAVSQQPVIQQPTPIQEVAVSSDYKRANLPQDFIQKCQDKLSEYYIAPMAQMIVNESIIQHNPTTPHQLVELVAAQLTFSQAERFTRQMLT